MRKPLRFAYAKLGSRYPRVFLAGQFLLTHLITLGGVGLLTLYQRMSDAHFWTIVLVSQLLVVVENVLSITLAYRLLRPADPWLRGERNAETATAAWRALAGLPVDFIRNRRAFAVFMNIVPISAFITILLRLPAYSFLVLVAGSAIVLLYGATVRFFATEMILRPVLERVSEDLPQGIAPSAAGIPLKLKLLAVLPAINVITGVVVSGLSRGGHARLSDLGISVLFALAVAFTISFELTVLLSRSVLEPIQDLRRATRRVAEGDFSVRVPVVTADETGTLTASFNQMVAGLEERRQLHEAFATFVDPVLADRVLEQGTALQGEEIEVTVLFVDIRDFTAFAERSSAAEVVGLLNEFFEQVVPVLMRHCGHANKFVGDGLLGVFGAPVRLDDHADRAVAAALEIADLAREHFGDRLAIGIGVNSGPVVAGTVGGGGRLEFTVIGDAVNTAARVEQATRETGDDLLITEATRCLLREDHGVVWVERAPVELKGKSERVVLYAPARVEQDGAARRRDAAARRRGGEAARAG
jgi:class 3 adenylate cyclase